ncbi:hypothetical protein [Streptomyces violaceusniger]|uniref:hypothetical protein n=1 Tax=Streptomyces violaceusniger TaxID=68280 RepID=UPI0031D844C5
MPVRWSHSGEHGRPSAPGQPEVVGLRFSYSYSSPAQLGDRNDAFECDLRQARTGFTPDGRFDEFVRTEAIIATRS